MTWTDAQAHALHKVFCALDKAGLPWMVLRNHGGLPWRNRSKDVDFGIAKGELARVQDIVSQTFADSGFSYLIAKEFLHQRSLTYFRSDGDMPQSLKIDLIDGLPYRGAHVFSVPELWRTARRVGGLVIPSEAEGAAMLWINQVLAAGSVKEKYRSDIRATVDKDGGSFRAVLGRVFFPSAARKIWRVVSANDVEGAYALRGYVRRSVWLRSFCRSPIATTVCTLKHLWLQLRHRSRRNPATFFSVAGPDGVGKTTFIEHFSAGLAALQVKDPDAVQVQHFRPHLMPNINELLTGKPEMISEFNNPHSAAPASMPSSLFRLTYYWLDYVLGYWLKLRRHLIRGRAIVFDRYFYDFIVDPRRSRLSLPGWVPRLYLAMTPKPDLVFFLDAEADQIHARKQELPPDEIERQLRAYRTLAERDPRRFVRLDAQQPPEAVARDALKATVERSFAKIAR